jgi:hypothetical protein
MVQIVQIAPLFTTIIQVVSLHQKVVQPIDHQRGILRTVADKITYVPGK